jgi:oxalate decarboxylase
MELPPENQPSLTPRRDLLKLALATGAGLALGAVSNSARAADASTSPSGGSDSLTTRLQTHRFKFKLSALEPQVDNAGGSVAECDKRNFPIVENGGAGIFLLKLKPGGLREPHWHPNCWEMDYVVSGTVRMTIIPPDGPAESFTLEPGDVAFVPQGFAHSIANIGDTEAVIPIVFNNELPTDLGLSTMYGGFPEGQFTQTFGVPASEMTNIPKPKQTLVVVPKV